MTPNAGEIAHYLRASRALAKASACGCGCHAEEIADARSDLEGIAFTTDDPALKLRCEAVLDGRPAVRELVREPFYDDYQILYWFGHGIPAAEQPFGYGTHFGEPIVILDACQGS